MADRVGQQLGNYRLIRLIGQGGFAEVYLGEHIYLGTEAAIKVLHTQLASEDIEHFRNEARTVARLAHPHIVRVLEFDVEGSTPFLVVDYAPQGTLRKRHPRGTRLPLPLITSYVTQVASALQYAHEQKVIHRDIKPENMLMGRHNEVLLSDFGIALVAQSSRQQSTQGMQDLAGTIAYMAPEQIQSHAIPASDQYGLGIVVYEWLSGDRPFHGSFAEIAVKQALVPPPSLRERVAALPPRVEEVVMTALAKDPKQRFPSVNAFALAFQQACLNGQTLHPVLTELSANSYPFTVSGDAVALSDQELLAQDLFTVPIPSLQAEQADAPPLPVETSALISAPPEPSKQGRISRRTLLLGLTGLAVAGVVGSGLAWLSQARGIPGTTTLPTALPGSESSLYTYSEHTDSVWSVVWSPDGKRVASASSDRTVQVWNADGSGQPFIYRGHSDSVYAVAWSPNGLAIASAGYDKTVQVWNAANGRHIFTYRGHSDYVWSIAWSSDNKRIASAGGDKTVRVWNAADGSETFTYRGHTAPVYTVAWSPDDTEIASAGSDKTVQIWKVGDGSPVFTYDPYGILTIWSVAWSHDGKRIASANDDKTVQVWDAAGANHLYIYYGHSDFVYTVAWSPDGKRIASAGDDKTVQVWDAADGNRIYTYSGHSASVRTLAWAPDGKRIASGSFDKTVQVWKVQ